MRPEIVSLGRVAGNDLVLTGRIDEVLFLGSVIRIRASLPVGQVMLDTFNRPDFPPPARGSDAEFSIRSEDLLVLA
jgi:putative spermidine/putrescine transport system ATP-binding protein